MTRSDVSLGIPLPRRGIVSVVLIGLLQAATLIALILLTRRVGDALIVSARTGSASLLTTQITFLAAVAIANAALRGLEFAVAERIGYDYVRRLRMRMYDHFSGMAPRQIQHRSRGSLILRFTGDLTMFRTWISRGIARGLVAAILVLAVAAVLAYIHPLMAAALFVPLTAGSLLSFQVGKRVRRTTRKIRRVRSLMTSVIDEQLHSLAVVQAFSRTRGERSRLSRQNDWMTRRLYQEAAQRGVLRFLSSLTAWFTVMCVVAVGAQQVMSGRATPAIVLTVVVALRYLMAPIRDLALSHDYWQRAQVSRRKIADFLQSSTRNLSAENHSVLAGVKRGNIEFRNVSVTGALSGLHASVRSGQIVAILGPVGAGKTTILSLVARFLEPDEGEVLINGRSLADCKIESVSRRLGMVGPDLPLLRGTVRRNVLYRHPQATQQELQRVLNVTGLNEVLSDLPGGLNAWVTEGGRNLSVGQRQQIALARAMVGNPPILLLDEATASLDDHVKEVFHDVIRRHYGTVLMVTHDETEAEIADVVWYVEKGAIARVWTGEEFRMMRWQQKRQPRNSAAG